MIDYRAVRMITAAAAYGGFNAGLAMAAVMAAGEKLGVFKVNLPKIDGEFFLRGRLGPWGTYLVGLVIHSFTSVGLALACLVGGMILTKAHLAFTPLVWGLGWSASLWIVFGLTVSPVVGIGLFGSRLGKLVWLELLATHLVYGLTLAYLAA